MATKRGKSQARRNGGGNSSGTPGWAWLVVGLALGVGVFLMAPKFLGDDGAESFFRPKPNADAQPPAVDAVSDQDTIVADSGSASAATGPADKPQDYDFYTLLPGDETALSDSELAERARAEEAALRAADKPSAATNPDAADPAVPPAIDTAANAASEQAAAPKPAAAAADDARYLLQAGAFAASGDAEALKAKIAFLGLSARVESAQIQDKTVYRVRMGPYGTATDLAEAKRKLAGGGLPAMAIKVK